MKHSLIVVCKAIPFDYGGSSKVLRSLFANTRKEDNVLLYGREPMTDIDIRALSLPYNWRISLLSDKQESTILKIIRIAKSTFAGLRLIKRNKTQAILGVYRDETSLILSWLISLMSGLPLHIYLTDLYAENYGSRKKKWLQSSVFRRANNVFCVNEGMQEIYQRKYQIKTTVIPHCVNEPSLSFNKSLSNNPFTILFSGNIVYDRLDLLQKMILSLKENSNYHIRLLCPHDESFLLEHNLLSSNVSFAYITEAEKMMEELRSADLLYLPLTFEKQQDERSALQLESCLGTKSFDYMQSGVPILVQCPKEYLTYQYFEERNAAVLVGEDDPSILFEQLELIRTNYDDYGKYAETAARCLFENDGRKAYDKLMKNIFDE